MHFTLRMSTIRCIMTYFLILNRTARQVKYGYYTYLLTIEFKKKHLDIPTKCTYW